MVDIGQLFANNNETAGAPAGGDVEGAEAFSSAVNGDPAIHASNALKMMAEILPAYLERAGESPGRITELVETNDDPNAIMTGAINMIAEQPGYVTGPDGKLEEKKLFEGGGDVKGQLSNVTAQSFTDLGATQEEALVLHQLYSGLRGENGDGLSIKEAWTATVATALGGDPDPAKAGRNEGMGLIGGGADGMARAVLQALEGLGGRA